MVKPIDMGLITIYLIIGLASYSAGLLTLVEVREATECYTPAFYAISGLIAIMIGAYFILQAIKEAVREARGGGYG
jgi:hypothetical protein